MAANTSCSVFIKVPITNQIFCSDPFHDYFVNRCPNRANAPEAYNSMMLHNQQTTVQSVKFRGVFRHLGRFETLLQDNSDPKETKGGFNDENMAARAHDLAVLKIYGTSASLNFPVTEYEEEMEEMKDMSKDEYLKSLKKRPTNGDPFKMKWEAKLKRAGSFKGVYLGRYVLMAATELVAARAHDIAAIKVWGRKAITNFDIGQYVFRGILESPLLPIRKGIFSQIANDDLQRLSSENRANSPADFDYDQPGNNAADEGF
ncbi:AP2-like ethylene-responsive transcription factor BBM2 [Linum perenne]